MAKSVKNSMFLFTKWDEVCRWKCSNDSSNINRKAIFGQKEASKLETAITLNEIGMAEIFILFRALLKQVIIREKVHLTFERPHQAW